jgi:hypothetical protein
MPDEPHQGRLIPEAKETLGDIRDLLAAFSADLDKHMERGFIEIDTSGLFRMICPHFRVKLK